MNKICCFSNTIKKITEVNLMGLLSAISGMRSSMQTKRIADMKEKGYCPECNGNGYNIFALSEFISVSPVECYSCDGTGTFSSWSEKNNGL
jgi:DnaJ-class molecular chaperone